MFSDCLQIVDIQTLQPLELDGVLGVSILCGIQYVYTIVYNA